MTLTGNEELKIIETTRQENMQFYEGNQLEQNKYTITQDAIDRINNKKIDWDKIMEEDEEISP